MMELDTVISFGKYKDKLLSDLLKDKNYTLWVIENCKSISTDLLNSIKFYYNKEIKDTNKPITGGNLTSRIKSLMENRIYDDIISCNIPNINIEFTEKQNIISIDFLQYIQDLHSIYPSGTGCFIDYLFRHILSKFLNIEFYDRRANAFNKQLNEYNLHIKVNNEIKLKVYDKYKDKWTYDEFLEIYEKIKTIEHEWFELCDTYKAKKIKELEEKYNEEELKIYNDWKWEFMGNIKCSKKWKNKYKKQLKMHEEYELINNQYFQSFQDYINNDEYYDICSYYQELASDKYELLNNSAIDIHIDIFNGLEDKDFPISFIEAYEKVINKDCNTKDIIKEIFVVSLAHNICFRDYNKEKSSSQFEYITQNKFEFIDDIIKIIKIFDGEKYALNPTLSYGISADCDLIIDDNLIDFKVSKANNDKYELLQLLGYSSLINVGNYKINKIHIIDLYKNKLKTIDISEWDSNQRSGFLNYISISSEHKDKKYEIEFIIKDKIIRNHNISIKPLLKYPNRYTKLLFEKFNELKNDEKFQNNFIKWKNGINYKTNRKFVNHSKIYKDQLYEFSIKYEHGSILFSELEKINQDDYITETELIKSDINIKNIEIINNISKENIKV